jgi:hypothetical protein
LGQIELYPSLVGLPEGIDRVTLVPDTPLKPNLAAALKKAVVEAHAYSVGKVGEKPSITFTDAFLRRCGA